MSCSVVFPFVIFKKPRQCVPADSEFGRCSRFCKFPAHISCVVVPDVWNLYPLPAFILAFLLRNRNSFRLALQDHRPFKLRNGRQHRHLELPCRRVRIKVFFQAYERCPLALDPLHDFQKICRRSSKPGKLAHIHGVSLSDVLQQLLQLRPSHILAGQRFFEPAVNLVPLQGRSLPLPVLIHARYPDIGNILSSRHDNLPFVQLKSDLCSVMLIYSKTHPIRAQYDDTTPFRYGIPYFIIFQSPTLLLPPGEKIR